MSARIPKKNKISELRKSAEDKLSGKREKGAKKKTSNLEHELHIHEIELEMQKQELYSAQLKLVESIENYTELFDYAPIGFFILDQDGVILNLNIKGRHLLDLDKKKIIGKPLSVFFNGELCQDDYYRHRNLVLETNKPCHFESEIKKNDGSIYPVFVETTFVKNKNGAFKYLLTTISDITERKKSELQLRYKVNELNTFMYKSTHDLRSPLTSLSGLVKIAKEISVQPELKSYFDMIDTSVNRMDKLLIDLFNIVNVTQGKLNISIIDFETMMNEILESLKNRSGFSGIIFRKKIKTDTLFFQSDAGLIYSVLQNLLDNAIKYRKNSEFLDSIIIIDISLTNKIAKIKITDNGIGIPTELQEKVFDMFYRATAESTGTGLGLYIVKNTVEKLGGEIQLKSEEKYGTSVSISLPNLME